VCVYALAVVVVIGSLRRWEGDRRRARDEAAARMRNERRLRAVVDFARHLASVTDRAELLDALPEQLTVTAGCDGALVLVDVGDRAEVAAVVGFDPRDVRLRESRDVEIQSPSFDAFRSGHPVYVPTTAELAVRYGEAGEFFVARGARSLAAVPVPGLGVVTLTWRQEQTFSVAQRAFLETLASLITAASARIRAVERSELERFVGAFDAMLDAVSIHRSVRDESGAIVDFEVEYLNPAAVSIGEFRHQLIGRRFSDLWSDEEALAEYARVVDTGIPYVSEDVDAARMRGPHPDAEALSIRAWRLDADRFVLAARDMTERVRLVREIRQANAGFEVAQQLAHVGSWRYEVRTGAVEWSAELCRIVGITPGDAPPGPIDEAFFGFVHAEDRARVRAAITRAVADRQPFALDMRLVRPVDGEVREVTTSGIVLVDDSGHVAAVWGATQDVTDRRRAERSERQVLEALEREREAVAELQRVILPPSLPSVDGAQLSARYRAATLSVAVGGDWYDAFAAPDGRVVIAIGDVAGHGIECATLANQLRVSVRVRAGDGMEPGSILALLDAEVGDRFVTCSLATYEPATRILRVANAGHLPAVLTRTGSSTLVAGYTSPPLGTGSPPHVEEQELVLEPGDLLVLFTDGLVERRGEPLDCGLDRLAAMAPIVAGVDDPAFTIVEQLAPDAADDVCVLTLRVLG
jgi:PAS domain S-box-containing protein